MKVGEKMEGEIEETKLTLVYDIIKFLDAINKETLDFLEFSAFDEISLDDLRIFLRFLKQAALNIKEYTSTQEISQIKEKYEKITHDRNYINNVIHEFRKFF